MFLRKLQAAVLVGGESRRMGRNKALLPFRGRTLVEHIAGEAEAAAGRVMLIGPPAQFGQLGWPVVEDAARGSGPLSGIVTALARSEAEWTLVVACDMPNLSRQVLGELAAHALAGSADAVLAQGPGGYEEPLLAAYRATCRPVLEAALAEGRWKVRDALHGLRVDHFAVSEECVRNANTPEEWERIEDRERA
ncbi:MAG: molybdenum cofactor guanylyltransferase [Bryobacterales bacterium]|nr:molybdenum cofactor guanylyltransferase [Bryobacterales bacterium]